MELETTLRAAGASAGGVLVMTGAGISAESGVPTFRGKEGYWTVGSRNYHPQEMATNANFGQMPREMWRWYLYRRGVCRRADPNAGHRALVDLERKLGDRFCLVTQNVDGLHLRAGQSLERTYQIHGNVDFMRCAQGCSGALYPMDERLVLPDKDAELDDATYDELSCPSCGGPSRPHVLWFDEFYDEQLFRADSALRAATNADLLIIVGTSGATNLPMQIAALAVRRGLPIIDINVEDNVFAQAADDAGGHALRGGAGEILPGLVATLTEAVQ